jgi:hypothetical protein
MSTNEAPANLPYLDFTIDMDNDRARARPTRHVRGGPKTRRHRPRKP